MNTYQDIIASVTLVLLALAQHSGRQEERMLRACVVSMAKDKGAKP